MILPWPKRFCRDEKDFAVTVVGHPLYEGELGDAKCGYLSVGIFDNAMIFY